MLKNYIKIAVRNLWKHKIFSAINILGLALGMACFFLVVLYVRHEYSYDRIHERLDRLYQVNYRAEFGGDPIELARVPPPMGPVLMDYFPEMEQVARLYPRNISVTVPETREQFEVEDAFFADSTVFQLFSFDFLQGDRVKALQEPFSVVLTDERARSFFGTTDVVGKSLQLVDREEFRVTGVVREWPDNVHLNFGMLVRYDNMFDLEPAANRDAIRQNLNQNWVASHSHTYVLLKPGADPSAVNEKFRDFLNRYGMEQFRDKQTFSIYPVKDIHLYSETSLQPSAGANLDYLYLFLAIGLLTLLIACINFVNLSTAGSLGRAREVGVRKVMGAGRGRLIGQFMGESLFTCLVAFLISLILIDLLLPYINDLTGVEMTWSPIRNWPLLLLFAAIFVLAGVAAGSYPAFFVSRFKPVNVLKGNTGTAQQPGGALVRKALITLQFVGAIGFIAGTLVVYAQLQYLRNQPMGFQKEQMLSVPVFSQNNMNAGFRQGSADMREKMNALDEAIRRNPNVEAVTQSAQLLGFGAVRRGVWTDKISQNDNIFMGIMPVDYDFAETFDLEVIAGRDFDEAFGTDHQEGFVINETAVRELQYETPEAAVGEPLTVEGKQGKVIGVIRDFHVTSLRNLIEPVIMEVRPGAFSYFTVRLRNQDLPQTIEYIRTQWREFFPAKAFEYAFLDESLDNLYESESRLASIIGYFAFLTIFISCFGLFGLAALATRQRTKEVGIRKVLGASLTQLIGLLSWDFMILIGLSMLIAIPIAWYLLNRWLEDFAYRVDMPWQLFLAAGLGTLVIAFLTISAQTLRTARRNPVEALRYE